MCSCGYQACLVVLGAGGWVVQERIGIGGWPVWFVGTGGWAVHKQVGSLVGPGCVIAGTGTDGWTCAVVGTGLGSGCGYRRRAMWEQCRAWLCCALWAPPLPPFMVSLTSLQLPVPPPTFLFSVLRASASLLRAPLLPSGQVPRAASRSGGAGPAPFHSLQPGGGGVDSALGLGSSITPAPLVHSQPPNPALLWPTGAQNPPLQSSLPAALPSSITAIVTCPVALGVWVQLESCIRFQLQNKGTWGGDGH